MNSDKLFDRVTDGALKQVSESLAVTVSRERWQSLITIETDFELEVFLANSAS